MKVNPDRPDSRGILRKNLEFQARSQAGLGDGSGAIETAESIARLGFEPAADSYASARAFSRSIPRAGRADPLRFADRAMAKLTKAVAAGYRDVATLRKEPALDPLRSRPDFQALMMDLAFPANPLRGTDAR